MDILHILFSDQRGGLEQAYIDYTEALARAGHRVTALIHPRAPFAGDLASLTHGMAYACPAGFYDPVATWEIARLIRRHKPRLVLAHNGRAITYAKRVARLFDVPVIGVSHGYKTRRCTKADALLTLTGHMREHFIAAGYDASHIAVQRNMIRLAAEPPPLQPWRTPPVIGAMGRFVEEKGFLPLIESLGLLKRRGHDFRAVIAGDGPLKDALREASSRLGLEDRIDWPGWITHKPDFYRAVDMFVLPSIYEPFGLVVLEAMAAGVPLVVSALPGPASMVQHQANGLLVNVGDSESMAEAIGGYLAQPEFARRMAQAGLVRVREYDLPAVSRVLDANLQGLMEIIERQKRDRKQPA